MTFYQTTGKSVKALSMDDVFGVGFESNLNSTSSDSSPRNLYTLVPFVRRAVRLRMNAIASVPVTLQKADTDLSTRPEWQGLMKNLPTALAKVEMALCLSPYGAYWRKNTNKIGLNPTPEWLLPQSIWPYITADEGLRYFRYVHPWGTERAGFVENLTPDQVVAFWYPSLDRASWPGSPPGVTAQPAGTALNAQDVFIASYFRRGAIKAVLLQVPPDAKPADRDRLTAWWRSIVGGVSNAWKSVVVQTNVTPVVIGDGLKEMNNESLTRQYRQDVAAAFDIPETMLMQGAANYATAKIDRIGFYEETIFPEHQMILDCINQQWLQPAYGAELVAHPEQTEARQDAQLSQAQALTELVGQPILTVDEGRAWIGFEPMAESQKPVDDSAEFTQMEQEASAVDQSEDSAEQVADPTKRYAHDVPTGQYVQLPGGEARKAERQTLLSAHSATRKAVQDRHSQERKQVRDTHATARQTATDARERLKATNRHAAEMQMLAQRQTAERTMLASLHTAERSRLTDRHAAQRSHEVATLRGQGAIKTIDEDESDFDLMDAEWNTFDAEEDALDFDDDAEVKQARDARGRFAASAGTAQRHAERAVLRQKHAATRTTLRAAHAHERATGTHDAAQKERHKAERQALTQQHRADRQGLRETHAEHRANEGKPKDNPHAPTAADRAAVDTYAEHGARLNKIASRQNAIRREQAALQPSWGQRLKPKYQKERDAQHAALEDEHAKLETERTTTQAAHDTAYAAAQQSGARDRVLLADIESRNASRAGDAYEQQAAQQRLGITQPTPGAMKPPTQPADRKPVTRDPSRAKNAMNTIRELDKEQRQRNQAALRADVEAERASTPQAAQSFRRLAQEERARARALDTHVDRLRAQQELEAAGYYQNGNRLIPSRAAQPAEGKLERDKQKIQDKLAKIAQRKTRLAEIEQQFQENRGKLSVEQLREMRKEIATLRSGKALDMDDYQAEENALIAEIDAVKAADPTPDDPDVQRLVSALHTYLQNEYQNAAHAVTTMPEAILSSSAVDQLPLDTGSEIAKILRRFYPLFVKAGWLAGADQLGVDLAFDLENPYVQQTLDSLASAIVGVSDTTRDEIRTLVGKQASEGWSIPTLAKMIRQAGDVTTRERALTIARTESASAQSQGSILSWQASGVVDRVTWLTSDPCPICAPLDGKTVAIGQPFAPGILHPPAHPRCKCALAAVVSEQRPIVAPVADSAPVYSQAAQSAHAQMLDIQTKADKAKEPIRAKRAKLMEERQVLMEERSQIMRDTRYLSDSELDPSRKQIAAIDKKLSAIRVRDLKLYGDLDDVEQKVARKLLEVPKAQAAKIVPDFSTRLSPQLRATINRTLESITRLTSTNGLESKTLIFDSQPNTRAYASDYGNESHMSGLVVLDPGNEERVIAHEVGHHIEFRNPAVQERAQAFLERRTRGEQPRALAEITGNPAYDAHEVATPDKFISPYMGKRYTGKSTEIISMGIEYFFAEPTRFAKEDPDMFMFIYDVLRS